MSFGGGGPAAMSVQGDTLVVGGPLSDWTALGRIGSGTITDGPGGAITLVEGSSFHVRMTRSIEIPEGITWLQFEYAGLSFDNSALPPYIRDAFEAALIGADGKPVVPTIDPGRDAYFNVTGGLTSPVKQATGVDSQAGTDSGIVKVNVAHLVGQTIRLELRLINNDPDTATTVTIAGDAPVNSAPELGPIPTLASNEGQSVTLTVPFTDPDVDDTHTALIDWGDNTFSNVVVPAGARTIEAMHVYADDRADGAPDQYVPKVYVTDGGGLQDDGQGVANVGNVSPSLSASMRFEPVLRGKARQMAAVISGIFTDPGFTREVAGTAETFRIDVNWGDGTTERLGKTVANGSEGVATVGSFTGSHVYAQPGIYDATVTVRDDDGGTTTQTFRYGVVNIRVVPKINLKNMGVIPVMILKDLPEFDPADVAVESLRFGPGGAPDQNQDPIGTNGAQVQFDTQASRIRPTDTVAFLYGTMQDGTPFVGMDEIEITPGSERGQNGVPATETPKFFVADTGTDNVYRYSAGGIASGFFNYDYQLTDPRGVAASPLGDTLWTIEMNGQVIVHEPDGDYLGNWLASDATHAVGVTTDGLDMWVVDKDQKKVFRYSGAAAQRAGTAVAGSSFALDAANASPSDLVTDGVSIWVVDDGANSVFKYTLGGVLLGSWALDAANANPSGIAWAQGQSDLWVVDRLDKVVYRYANATVRTSGSQAAADTFALAAANASPEGIADPPTVRVAAPAAPSQAPVGSTVLVSGRASDGTSVADRVEIDGAPADVVDVAGNFFARVPVLQGPNTIDIGATDPQGVSATGQVRLEGVSSTSPGAIDFTLFTDVTSRIGVQYGRTSFNEKSATLYTELVATNTGSPTIASPLMVGIRNVSDTTIGVSGYDGLMPDGTPYFRLAPATPGATSLPTDAQTATRSLAFHNPNGIHFDYDLVFLAPANHAPTFSTVPIVRTPVVDDEADASYVYEFDATDVDGDDLTFARVSGPAGMTFQSIDTDNDGKADFGRITWRPTQVGEYPILLGADDGVADGSGQAHQAFILSVVDSTVNRPPRFTSDPVVEARIGTDYVYQATATDLDNDDLEFSIVGIPPAGMSITTDGLLEWSKESLVVGDQLVTLKVIDRDPETGTARGTQDLQPFTIRVLPALGNHAPEIVSTPVTTFRPAVATGLPRKITLDGRVRDFKIAHPDFEQGSFVQGHEVGNIDSTLSPDGKPVYIGLPHDETINSAETFDQWYRDLEGINLGDSLPLVLTETSSGSGVYGFSSSEFFPIDGQLFGADPGYTHNFHFTYEVNSRFTYQGGESLTFTGDDDVWVFLNGRLAIALGGVHGPMTGSVDLDESAEELGLVPGESYTFDLFFAERQWGGSSFALTTGIEFEDAGAYKYDVDAIDADEGDVLTYSLIGDPPDWLRIDPVTGVITGNPTADDVGTYDIDVLASDGRGGTDVQSYPLVVEVPTGNSDPVFSSTPPTRLEVGGTYVYQAQATDADGDPLEYRLVEGPFGMAIDRHSGRLTWTPSTSQPDEFDVQIQVTDGHLGGDDQQFTIVLERGGNSAPSFSSSPVLGAGVGQDYLYQSAATDPENDPLVYSLAQKPLGMAIDPKTGRILWHPTAEQIGTHDVVVVAKDAYGAIDSQPYTITVTYNGPPVVVSVPAGPAYVGATYQGHVVATDPEGETLTFSLDSASDVDMDIDPITGVFTWTPSATGTRTVEVSVEDDAGLITTREFTIEAVAAVTNRPPVVNGLPRATIQVGRQYFWVVNATDPDSDKLYYDLDGEPDGMSVTADGIVSWTPTAEQIGEQTFTIEVDDQRTGGLVTETFAVDVVSGATGNLPPHIDSKPTNVAVSGKGYVYIPSATDPDNDPLVWALDQKPPTMSIDPVSGAVAWTPTDDDIGKTFDVILRVTDVYGASIAQKFPITVRAVNAPPRIESDPMPPGKVGLAYRHTIRASDPEGGRLTYEMSIAGVSNNNGLVIDGVGRIGGTPTTSGTFQATITVTDDEGLTDSETYALAVAATSVNLPPRVLTTPPFFGVPGQEYRYEFKALDPEGVSITYSLVQAPPAGSYNLNTSTGVFTWTPPSNQAVGTYPITIRASDGTNSVDQEYGLILRANTAPLFVNVPPSSERVVAETPYVYDVDAVDVAGDVVSYELAGPSWLNIDPETGVISGEPPVGAVSSTPHSFTVTALDQHGASASHTFELTVAADAAPIVFLQTTQTGVAKGSAATFYVWADDDVEVASLTLTAGGKAFPIAADGFAHVVIDDDLISGFGNLVFTATATDTAGQTATDTVTINVYNPADQVAPEIEFTGPADNETIYKPTDVTASISDDNQFEYRLEIAPIGESSFKTLVDWTDSSTTPDGSGRYNASLAHELDTTTMLNGTYVLRISARDGQHESVAEQVVTVDGSLKIGNFSLSFNDLSVPVAGIPINITRTYDTVRADTEGDFGYGWTMDVGDVKIHVAIPTGSDLGEYGDTYPSFRAGTRVYIAIPGQRPQGFEFTPVHWGAHEEGQFQIPYIQTYYRPKFTPLPGTTSTLSVEMDDVLLKQAADGSFYREADGPYGDGLGYNPALFSFGGLYYLTTRDGTRLQINALSSKLEEIRDLNGNTLSFSHDGIRSSTGVGITFERDSRDRITKIIDPDDKEIVYEYTADGDLASVTDRASLTTQFFYGEVAPSGFSGGVQAPEHFLTRIVDPRGIDVARAAFDDQNRFIGMLDAEGNQVDAAHGPINSDETRFTETVTDALDNVTEFEYDERGNVTREVRLLVASATASLRKYIVVAREYWEDTDELKRESEPFEVTGFDNRFTATPTTWRSTTTYVNGLPATRTDAEGNTTYFAYAANGRLSSVTDPLGNTSRYVYDANGNLTATINAKGERTENHYDALGNLTETLDSHGRVTSSFTYNGPGGRMDSSTGGFIYDAAGNLTGSAPPRTFTYDAFGNVDSSTYEWDDPTTTGTVEEVEVTTSTEYDDAGRVTSSTDADGQTTSTTYNDLGKPETTTDRYGNVTRYRYDVRGNLIETEYPDQSLTDGITNKPVTRTVYDALGRPVVTVDMHVPGTAANGTRTTYDKVGRVVSTERLANVVINIQETGSGSDVWEIVPQSGGVDYTFTSVISTSATTYDAAGRADVVTGADGQTTDYDYDPLGRVASVEDALGNVMTYDYDESGRQTSVTDANLHTTAQTYDALGRVIKTTFHDNSSTSVEYDDLGRKVSDTDQLGQRTQYEYDSRGNLTAVVQPHVIVGINLIGDGGAIARPRWEYEYSQYGNLVFQRDPQDNKFTGSGGQNRETTFKYDEQNRRVERKLPLGQTELSFYDAFGRLERMTDFKGQNHTFEYDALGRVDEEKWFGVGEDPETDPAGQTVTYRFDALGRQDRVTEDGESDRVTTYAFDIDGRLTSVDAPEGRVNYGYDAATGRHVRTWTGTNSSSPTTDTLYGYDELGRLKSVTSAKLNGATPATAAVQLDRYDAVGNAVSTTLPTTTYGYDDVGNRTPSTRRAGGGRSWRSGSRPTAPPPRAPSITRTTPSAG
ncbi:MAG: putative Ig domain-containing protein [Tepidisphaeraceae bacterium]